MSQIVGCFFNQAAEHWMKVDVVDNNDTETFVNIANVLKTRKDAFLKEAMEIFQPAIPDGVFVYPYT
jgi:hypothetical protein